MRPTPWPRRNLTLEPGEDLFYRNHCSWAPRARWISLVGGEIFVTTRCVAFRPNLLAALMGRESWQEPLGDIDDMYAEPLNTGRVFGALPSLRVVLTADAETAPRSRTIVMKSAEAVGELRMSIDRGKWWL
jgi:hypothetical protein